MAVRFSGEYVSRALDAAERGDYEPLKDLLRNEALPERIVKFLCEFLDGRKSRPKHRPPLSDYTRRKVDWAERWVVALVNGEIARTRAGSRDKDQRIRLIEHYCAVASREMERLRKETGGSLGMAGRTVIRKVTPDDVDRYLKKGRARRGQVPRKVAT